MVCVTDKLTTMIVADRELVVGHVLRELTKGVMYILADDLKGLKTITSMPRMKIKTLRAAVINHEKYRHLTFGSEH